MSKKLLDNVSTNIVGPEVRTDGGSKTIAVWATSFGSKTVTIQGSPDGGVAGGNTWIPLSINGTPVTYAANEIRMIDRLGQGMLIRAVLAGSGEASNVNARIFD